LIDTSNDGTQIKLETAGDTSPIELTTNGNGSNIELLANLGEIDITAVIVDINAFVLDIDALSVLIDANNIDLNTNVFTLDATNTVDIVATNDASIESTNSNINVKAPTGVAPATINGTNVKVNGSNHITHSTPLTTPLDENIMLSGVYANVNAVSGTSNIFISSWIRIGNVVTFSGGGTCAVGSPLTFNLPIIKSGGGGFGSGTATVIDGLPPALTTCTLSCLGSTFKIADVNGNPISNAFPGQFTFSFTYILQ